MRRAVILSLVVFTVAALGQQPPAAPPPQQQQQQQPQQAPPQQRISPEQLWAALQTGNKTFIAGKISFDDLALRRDLTKEGQIPPITILSCSDSRVPAELVFNQSVGTMFVVRTAGNVADDIGVASIEFAILMGWTRLIVVMGHEECGAIKAALGGADPAPPALAALARRIRTSFIGVRYDSRDQANVRKATEMNARASAAHLLASSKVIRDAVLTEQAKLIVAYYELATGEVKLVE